MRNSRVVSLLLILVFVLPASNLFVEAEGDIIVPTARAGHSMVYVPTTEEIIVYGGMRDNLNLASSYLNDTWKYSYSNNKWTELNSSIRPSSRSSSSMVYDPVNNRLLLFGGTTFNTRFNDTWELDLDSYEWKIIDTENAPTKVADAVMVFDELNEEIFLFGGAYYPQGYSSDSWIFNVNSNVWNKLTVSTHPSSRYGHKMVYSNINDAIYLFGGHAFNTTDTVNNDSWWYNCNSRTWSEITPPSWPSSRYWHAITYDVVNERIFLFGGRKNIWTMDCWGDTWGYHIDSNVWSQIQVVESPPARMYFPMVYHSAEDKTILFGGCQDPNTVIFGDMWSYSSEFNKWVEIDPTAIHTSSTSVHSLVILSMLCIISITWQYKKRK
ncbi:MAG: Kelch repeat-containing protein [Candidatus Heimdallarchaeaceae archaeon]